MTCYKKSSCMAINTASQAVAANGMANFATSNTTGCSISYINGSNTVTLKNKGLYYVNVSAELIGTTAGTGTIQLLKNNTAVPGAQAAATLSSGDTANLSFAAVIDVLKSCDCINNKAALQVQLSGVGATVNNITMTVIKIA